MELKIKKIVQSYHVGAESLLGPLDEPELDADLDEKHRNVLKDGGPSAVEPATNKVYRIKKGGEKPNFEKKKWRNSHLGDKRRNEKINK